MAFLSKKKTAVLFLGLYLLSAASSFAADAPQKPSEPSKPIQVHGDVVEYFQDDQRAVGTGHVRIDYEEVRLEADKITVYMSTKKALAEGNVVLTQNGSVFRGKRVEYDFGKKIGYVDQMDATIKPEYYAKAKTIEKVDDNHFRATNTYVTTCCGDSPFYRIESQSIDIFPEDKIVIRNALMYIKNVPILFVPYYVQPLMDFDRLPVQLFPGRRKEWGTFLLSKWRYNLVNRQDMTVKGNVNLDWRDRRGFAGGPDVYYKGDKIGRGVVRGYYAYDKEPSERAEPDRYRGQWRHQSKLAEDTTVTAEINDLSDDSFIKDFFYREEYEKNQVPENYVSVIQAKPEYTLSLLERHRLNNFVNSVNRDPEVRFDTHNRQWSNTPFYLREEAQFSNLTRQYNDSRDELDATRFDWNNTLTYAGRVGDVNITPRTGFRTTYYSRDLDGEEGRVRTIVDPGIDVNTRFYKTYDVYIDAFGLDINKVRHIFQPTVSYNYRPTPSVYYQDLQQFDEIDALDKQNFVRFNFENKLQTKHKNPDGSLYTREFARIIPFFDYNFLNDRIQDVGLQTELRPYSWLGFQSDVNYDTHLGRVETANFDVYFDRGPWKVSVGQRYVIDESSQTTAEVKYRIKDYEVTVYDRFEFQEGTSKEFEVTLSKYWDCVITDFTYNHRYDGGDTFYFALRLKAFPSTPFGFRQSYNRPKAASADYTL